MPAKGIRAAAAVSCVRALTKRPTSASRARASPLRFPPLSLSLSLSQVLKANSASVRPSCPMQLRMCPAKWAPAMLNCSTAKDCGVGTLHERARQGGFVPDSVGEKEKELRVPCLFEARRGGGGTNAECCRDCHIGNAGQNGLHCMAERNLVVSDQ